MDSHFDWCMCTPAVKHGKMEPLVNQFPLTDFEYAPVVQQEQMERLPDQPSAHITAVKQAELEPFPVQSASADAEDTPLVQQEEVVQWLNQLGSTDIALGWCMSMPAEKQGEMEPLTYQSPSTVFEHAPVVQQEQMEHLPDQPSAHITAVKQAELEPFPIQPASTDVEGAPLVQQEEVVQWLNELASMDIALGSCMSMPAVKQGDMELLANQFPPTDFEHAPLVVQQQQMEHLPDQPSAHITAVKQAELEPFPIQPASTDVEGAPLVRQEEVVQSLNQPGSTDISLGWCMSMPAVKQGEVEPLTYQFPSTEFEHAPVVQQEQMEQMEHIQDQPSSDITVEQFMGMPAVKQAELEPFPVQPPSADAEDTSPAQQEEIVQLLNQPGSMDIALGWCMNVPAVKQGEVEPLSYLSPPADFEHTPVVQQEHVEQLPDQPSAHITVGGFMNMPAVKQRELEPFPVQPASADAEDAQLVQQEEIVKWLNQPGSTDIALGWCMSMPAVKQGEMEPLTYQSPSTDFEHAPVVQQEQIEHLPDQRSAHITGTPATGHVPSGTSTVVGRATTANSGAAEKKRHQCSHCSKVFSENCQLVNHIRIHTGERPYQCLFCSQRFKQKGHLQAHHHTHTSDRPYKCDVCDSSFAHQANLNKHYRIHTGSCPYQCDICKKNFKDSSNLTRHRRIHTGERPYRCELCPMTCTESGRLKKHLRIHKGVKPFNCNMCEEAFPKPEDLRAHKNEVHVI